MLRFFFNLLLIALLVALISAQTGAISWQFGPYLINTTTPVMLGALLLLVLLVWLLAKVWFWLKHGLIQRRERRLRLAHARGLEALTLTFSALAGNNLPRAAKTLQKAEKLLGQQALVTWLGAELAARRGDEGRAAQAYQALTTSESAAVLGWRGLLKNKNNSVPQLALTQQALQQKPMAQHDFVHEAHLKALAQNGRWAEIITAAEAARHAGALNKNAARRLQAVAHLMQGLAQKNLAPAEALAEFASACKLAPDLTPASLAYARLLHQQGKEAQALKVLQAAWLLQPHPDVLALYYTFSQKEAPLQRLEQFAAFALKRKDHVLTQLALAELSLAAALYGKARTHAENAEKIRTTSFGKNLLTAISMAESGRADSKAHNANQTPSIGGWQCHACHSHHSAWDAVCDVCHSVATIDWVETEAPAQNLTLTNTL